MMELITMVNTTRFGDVAVAPADILHFPDGLIGLSGTDYTLLPAGPGPFVWLQSLADPGVALPLTRPERFFPGFALDLAEEDRERMGADAVQHGEVYVTVRATPAAGDCTANLKAPIVVIDSSESGTRSAHQVINQAAGAQLRAPLFSGG